MGVAGAGVVAASAGFNELIAKAVAAAPTRGALSDIDHVIILMQENRSFDHYFGTLSGVLGFDDHRSPNAFVQRDSSGGTVQPFNLDTFCLPDLTHDWAPQHRSWNGGRMDGFLQAHEDSDPPGVAPETMGYYKRSDIGFYYALADAFTICDRYHCSVIGPTDPNRLMSMSASIDPAGANGGPLIQTLVATRASLAGHFTWTTMPEQLQAAGVSWKVYTSPAGGIFDNVLGYFKAFQPGTPLAALGIDPTFPGDFMTDLQNGTLPQVSWLLPGVLQSEHPGFSTAVAGEIVARQIVEAIVAQPDIWRRTALFITWDENGGFFDHVPPPTPPPGQADGEFLTVSPLPAAAEGIAGPIGLGFRVPMLVVSPFSTGGLLSSEVYDHTSTLRFLETRFGVEVPNLSFWRRRVTGDLTGAFNFRAAPDFGAPTLPDPGNVPSCPAPPTPPSVPSQPFPTQEPGRRAKPSGLAGARTR